jgi:hypothetical protein
MKTMTCRQMGGACDAVIEGNTVGEMMQNGAKHLHESGEEGDKKALEMMNDMQGKPEEQKTWEEDFKSKFAQLPED